ncbi:MAG: hypothetical protein E4H28_08265 [Gemmatimonadales bacterium]|nr:MAG: hypothetical protein E4H28_08265 [Gemmatimonadales bacterium]
MLKSTIRGLWNSPALRIAAGYGLAGVAFTGAMLLLSSALTKPEYGLFGLVVAILNFTSRTAPLGLDGIVNRHRMDHGPRLLGRVIATAIVFATGISFLAWLVYDLDVLTLALIFVGTVAGAASFVAASQFQANQKFGVFVSLDQGPNLVLLGAAVVTLTLGLTKAFVPITVLVGGFSLAAILGWTALFRSRGPNPEPGEEFHWGEALSYWGVAVGSMFLNQLSRFMTPELLSFEALATFSVLAAVVGAPFHMLELGVRHTLLPRLRREPTPAGRRHLIRREGSVTGFVFLGTAGFLLVATPWIVRLFVGDKYILPTGLIIAALILGLFRLTSSYAKTIVKSIGTTADLVKLNLLSWISIALAAGGAMVGARWGLEGLLYGIGVGWIGHTIAGFALGAKHLRESAN